MASEVMDSTNSTDLHSLLSKLMENQQRMSEDCKKLTSDSHSSRRHLQELNQITNRDIVDSTDLVQFSTSLREFCITVGFGWTSYISDIDRVLRHVYSAQWQVIEGDETNNIDHLLHALENIHHILDILHHDQHFAYVEMSLKQLLVEMLLAAVRVMTESQHGVLHNTQRCNRLKKLFQMIINAGHNTSTAYDHLAVYLATLSLRFLRKAASGEDHALSKLLEEKQIMDHFELFKLSSAKSQLSALLPFTVFAHSSAYDDLLQACRNLGNVQNNWLLSTSYIQCLTRHVIRALKYIPQTNNHTATKKLLHACIFGDGRVLGVMEVWKQSTRSANFTFHEDNHGANSISSAAGLASFLHTVLTSGITKIMEGVSRVDVNQLNKIAAKINKSCNKAISNNQSETIEVDVSFALLQLEGIQQQVEYLMASFKDVLDQFNAVWSYLQVLQSHFSVLGPAHFYLVRNDYRHALLDKQDQILTLNNTVDLKELVDAMQQFHEDLELHNAEDDIGEELQPLNILASILLILQGRVKHCIDEWDQVMLSQFIGIQEHLDHLRQSFSNWRQRAVLSQEAPDSPQSEEWHNLCQGALNDLNAGIPAMLNIWSQAVFLIGSKVPVFQLTSEVLVELEQQCSFVVRYSPPNYFGDVKHNPATATHIHQVLSMAIDSNRDNGSQWGTSLGGMWALCAGDIGAMTTLTRNVQTLLLDKPTQSQHAEEIAVLSMFEMYVTCQEVLEGFVDEALETYYGDLLQQALQHLGYCIVKSKFRTSHPSLQDILSHKKYKLVIQHMIDRNKTSTEDELKTAILHQLWAQDSLHIVLRRQSGAWGSSDVTDSMKLLTKAVTSNAQHTITSYKLFLQSFGVRYAQTVTQLDHQIGELQNTQSVMMKLLDQNSNNASAASHIQAPEPISSSRDTVSSKPLVPSINENDEVLHQILDLLQELHQLFQQQREQLKEPSPVRPVASVSVQDVERQAEFRAAMVVVQQQVDANLQKQTVKLAHLEDILQSIGQRVESNHDHSNTITKMDMSVALEEMVADVNTSVAHIVQSALHKTSTEIAPDLPSLQEAWCVQLSEMFNSFMVHNFKDDPDIITTFEDEEYFNLDVKKMQKLLKKIAHVLSSKISNYSKHLSAKLTELVLFHNNKLMPRVDYLHDELKLLSGKVDQLMQAVSRKQYDRLAIPKSASSRGVDDVADHFRPSTSLQAASSSLELLKKSRPASPSFSRSQRFYKSKEQQDVETEMSFVLERKYIGEGSPYAKKIREAVKGNLLPPSSK